MTPTILSRTARFFEIRSERCSIDGEVRDALRKYLLHKCEQLHELTKIELSKGSIDKGEVEIDLETFRGILASNITKALRQNPGYIKVTGTIFSLSKSYKVLTKAVWRCHNKACNQVTTCPTVERLDIENIERYGSCPLCLSKNAAQHEYEYRIQAKLQDEESKNNEEYLKTIFAGEASYGLEEGEIVTVLGKLKFDVDGRGKDKRLFPVLYVRHIFDTTKHENDQTAIFARHLEDIMKEEKTAISFHFPARTRMSERF